MSVLSQEKLFWMSLAGVAVGVGVRVGVGVGFGCLCGLLDLLRVRVRVRVNLTLTLTQVPDSVASFNDVCNALRHATQLCEVLSNQMTHVSNTYCLRIALIQHLVTTVVPL